jgi:hypothetical protein
MIWTFQRSFFFRGRNSNVVNFDYEADCYRVSEVLSWKEKNGKEAVNPLVAANLTFLNMETTRPTPVALERILDDGPLTGLEDVHSPVLGPTAVFSANRKALRRTDAPELMYLFRSYLMGENGARMDACRWRRSAQQALHHNRR